MNPRNAVAFVTGANRGLGQAYVTALLEAGARKVYAAARDPASVTPQPGVEAIALDVTNVAQIAAAAARCGDVNLLINNAGILRGASFLSAGSAEHARAELETNFFAPLALSKAFAPILAANGGGAIVNMLSVLSWINLTGAATYCASKSAAWSLTNGLRHELRGQGTQVIGVHVGLMETDMAKGVPGKKTLPNEVARQVIEALKSGGEEVLADALSKGVKAGLAADPAVYLGAVPE